ncbi:MAG: deoxyribodipyrimidine photo-lyase [Janthinobacterium lividum]
MAKRSANTDTTQEQRSVATPPGESAHDEAAAGMSEGDASALSHHPAREKAVRAASAAIQQQAAGKSPGKRTTRSKRAPKDAGAEDELRRAEKAAKLPSELPEALRLLASADRVTVRRDGTPDPKGKVVVYWMQRAQRAFDNPALDCAVDIANELGLPVVVYFAGISNFPHANLRHYVFLNEGLRDVEADLQKRNISFVLRNAPHEDHLQMFADASAALVIGDENPMREPERWRAAIATKINVPFWTVDADSLVPMSRFDKVQYAAYTIRNRLWKMVPDYLQTSKNPHAKHAWTKPHGFHADDVQKDMTAGWKDLDRTVGAAPDLHGGAHAAHARLQYFVAKLLPGYGQNRNHPDLDATSVLSPYLHYGHISSLTIYLAIEAAVEQDRSLRESADGFLDELVTWRELCTNYVLYNPHYDDPECAEDWARKTVAAHADDVRDPTYTVQQMERAETYDELWNAAQRQGVRLGWMHNFMRMYWAKKILEWSPDNATAMKTAIYLNDKYFIDGRDPGGYAGIAWAIYGKFDRPWGERKIFGKIRYMSGASSGKKFNSKAYMAQYPAREGQAANTPERARAHRAKGQYGG